MLLPIPASEWMGAGASVNGASWSAYAGRHAGIEGVFVAWPRSGPGRYEVRYRAGPIVRSEVVTVAPRKLGDEGFTALLDELEQELPAAIAISLQRAGALLGIQLQPPGHNTVAQELLRLRRAIIGSDGRPGLRTVLPAIGRDPHEVLTSEEVWIPRERAHRAPASAMVRVASRHANLDDSGGPIRVIALKSEPTANTYENRLLKHFTLEVEQRARRLTRYAEASGKTSVADELALLRSELSRARRTAPFLDDVPQTNEPFSRTTMLLLRERRYRGLLDAFIEFHRSLWVSLNDDALEAPLQNVPYLYEVWGTLAVIRATLDVAQERGYRLVRQELARPTFGGLFIEMVKSGRVALELSGPNNERLTVTPQRSFAKIGPFRSESFEQIPDVVVELARSNTESEMVFFDPKYKLDGDDSDDPTGRPVKSDIDKMHAYRDAVRGPVGNRVVSLAAIMYPGPSAQFGDGVAAIRSMPGELEFLYEELRDRVCSLLAKRSEGD